jgi:hypothetical protein
MRRWIAGLALTAAAGALAGALPAGAEARVVVANARAFPVAAAGGSAHLTVVVTNAGRARSKPSKVRVALVGPGGKRRRIAATGTGFPARDPGRSRTLAPAARLPRDVRAGTRVDLRVCVRRSCRGAGEVIVAGPTSLELIDTAETTGAVFAGAATLLRMQAAWSDRRLPTAYRVRSRDPDDHAAVVEAAAAFPLLSRADRARVLPYFLPKVVRDARPRAAAAAGPCTAIAAAWKRARARLHRIPAAGGKVAVWYPDGHLAGARRYARAFDDAWPKLTSAFRAPLLDGGGCLPIHGQLNVFVEPPAGYRAPGAAIAAPVPTATRSGPAIRCTRTPAFVAIEDGAPRAVVPHELMHAIQFAYRYVTCQDLVPLQDRWLDEGTATWAGDFVYPRDDYEHRYGRGFSANSPIWAESYGAWPFWYFLAKSNGTAVLRDVFARLATSRARAAVNAAIPGGYAEQYPAYLRWLRNGPPVGETGFPVAQSFAALDGVALKPATAVDRSLSLGGAAERTFETPAIDARDAHYCTPRDVVGSFSSTCDPVDGSLAPQTRVYQHFAIADPSVRELRFENGLAAEPGEHVEAWLKLADASWRVADWSAATSTLCRDLPGDDASELWVVTTNVGVKGDGFPALVLRNRLRARDHCELVSYEGPFSGTAHVVAGGQDATTAFHGTLRLDPATKSTEWKIGSSSLSLDSLSGTLGGCAASADPESFAMPTLAQEGTAMSRSDDRYTLRATAPEDTQLTVHLAGQGCSDEIQPLAQFVHDVARSEAPLEPGPDGTIADSATLSPADGVTEELTFSLAPVP